VGNTHEIQNGRNPVRDWFIPVATKVKPDIAKNQTAQGRYVVAADGTAYGFNNNRSVERVLALMDKSLAQFKANPPARVEISQDLLNAQPEAKTPDGASVVRLYTRIKPAPLGSDSSNANVNRDHFWILPDEAKALSRGEVPESLKYRLARFALVDNVRGEPDHWRAAEVLQADFTAKPGRKVAIAGKFRMATADRARGYEGTFEGEAEVAQDGRLRGFKGIAEGEAWGRSTYTPNPPEGRFPLKVAFTLAGPNTPHVVNPQAVFYGREYLTGR
jgi:hypothetical protein